MTDESAGAALRSDASLVLIEAPAGCGKTHQAAEYVSHVARNISDGRVLVLTHTHAACAVFERRADMARFKVEICTIDSFVTRIASAYHSGLGLPDDVATWARNTKNGYSQMAALASELLKRHSAIRTSLAQRFPVIICDEHQDASGEQHELVMILHRAGARVRIFADPMQAIYKQTTISGAATVTWEGLAASAEVCDQLDVPHRWVGAHRSLGEWILRARSSLKEGRVVSLGGERPPGLDVVYADNQAQHWGDFRLNAHDRRPIDTFLRDCRSVMVLTRHNEMARSFRPFFNRRVPLWEGHVRDALQSLASAVNRHSGDASRIAQEIVSFIQRVAVGFTKTAYAAAFCSAITDQGKAARSSKQVKVKALARLIVEEPDHRGVSKVLRDLAGLIRSDRDFAGIKLDNRSEFFEATRFGEYACAESALSQISRRRAHSRTQMPARAISTIHKAKGLECDTVIVMPCAERDFPDNEISRRILYVAMSRARERLVLVLPRANHSPLFSP